LIPSDKLLHFDIADESYAIITLTNTSGSPLALSISCNRTESFAIEPKEFV
jgi:hypothetical protein